MLILASQSKSRQVLLAGAGLDFRTEPAGIDERALEAKTHHTPDELARKLAVAKAEIVSAVFPGTLVIGADQVLALEGEVLHKPENRDGVRARFDLLRGKTHELLSGVALARGGKAVWSTVETAKLTMRDFTDTERDQVLALEGDDALASVGAYRLEGPSIRLFEKIEGDYFTILGLPLLPLLAALRNHAPESLEPVS
jgi:septum formation protein